MATSTVKLNGTTLMTVNDTTAVAADVAQNKYFYGADGVKTAGTATGGGGGSSSGDDVRFYDYDGTLLYSYSAAEFANLSAMPANPSHTGLTAQGWNWTLADAKAYVLKYGMLDIGQMYITSSGDTEIDVSIDSETLSSKITLVLMGEVSVDWGDNTTPDTESGTNATVTYEHDYQAAGNYTIKIKANSGAYRPSTANGYSKFFWGGFTGTSNLNSNNMNYMYYLCVNEVRFGSGVSQIPVYTFYNCVNLKRITIPNGVSVDFSNTFAYCENLLAVIIPAGTSIPSGMLNAFINAYSIKIISFPKYPSGTGIASGNYPFSSCRSLRSLTLPEFLTGLGTSFADGCRHLDHIVIPDSVTSISNYLLQNCHNLKKVYLSAYVTSIGYQAFQYCYSLQTITLPNTLTSIGYSMFSYCYNLPTINIPSSITAIPYCMFQYCGSLSSISIPNTVTTIGYQAFSECSALKQIQVPENVSYTSSSSYANHYYGCSTLESISLPSNMTVIPKNFLYSCNSIKEVEIPSSVTTIESNAFYNMYNIKSITLPSTIASLGGSCFYNNWSLVSVTIPSTAPITSIPTSAFTQCYSLKSFQVPNNVTEIGNSAFSNCPSMETISLPEGLLSIGSSAFSSCYALSSITIPSTVTSIGNSAFSNAKQIMEYHLLPTAPPTLGGSSVFTGISANAVIYVPYSSDHSILAAYKSANNWSAQASKIQEEPQ